MRKPTRIKPATKTTATASQPATGIATDTGMGLTSEQDQRSMLLDVFEQTLAEDGDLTDEQRREMIRCFREALEQTPDDAQPAQPAELIATYTETVEDLVRQGLVDPSEAPQMIADFKAQLGGQVGQGISLASKAKAAA